jgi:hypothetical protein
MNLFLGRQRLTALSLIKFTTTLIASSTQEMVKPSVNMLAVPDKARSRAYP